MPTIIPPPSTPAVRAACLAPAALVALVALAGTAHAEPAATGPVATPGALGGEFDNARQVRELAPGIATRPTPGQPWLDAQWARFVPFHAPALGELVYYLEWRAGSADAAITRQRVWAFTGVDGPQPLMRFYTLAEPERWAAVAGDPGSLAELAGTGLREYPAGCELRFERAADGRLDGRIPDGACVIVARESGRTMRIDAAITIGAYGFEYDEAGTLGDGRRAFLVPEGYRYRFERRP